MINQLDPKHRQTLSEIQGNILKGHGRDHTANIFISGKASQQAEVRQWLKSLVSADNSIIKSGYEQLYANHLWKTQGIDGGTFACIHISMAGYVYLFGAKEANSRFGGSFGIGMKNADLKDPLVECWEDGFQEEIHFHLLIADKNEQIVKEKYDSITNDISQFAKVVNIVFGNAIKNTEGAGIEHFGYVDGISQPLFFEDELRGFKQDHNIPDIATKELDYNPSAPMNLVLVQDPFYKSAQGSFFVFRKLEQNVKGFKIAEENLADALGLTGEDKERAGAMIVGRFEDGTPVQVDNEAGLIGNSVYNNFNYDSGDISKCPFHAHIRKTNPRNDIDDAKDAVMARRGIPYGKRTDNPFDGNNDTKPTCGVGLLFQSYQASIEKQFERIQKQWANNTMFMIRETGDTGLDLIIGQGEFPSTNKYQKKWGGNAPETEAMFEQFVTMKGGEYFFAPSIGFLKNI